MIRSFRGITPQIAATAYIDESAQIIGDVVIGEHSSVWPQAVIRGDDHYIRIDSHTNIQDNAVLHVESELYPLVVGDQVHDAIVANQFWLFTDDMWDAPIRARAEQIVGRGRPEMTRPTTD